MLTISRRALIALGLAFASIGAARAEESACACPDVADLRNRMCEARAAISEYTKQISLIREAEKKTGKPVMYTVPLYKAAVQPCVQEAINQVTDQNANRPTGNTNNGCQIEYGGNPTACMKQSLFAHESIHVTACKKWEGDHEGFFAELRGKFGDFREGTTLVDLLNEERVAYQVESNHVRDEISRLSQKAPGCPGLPAQPPGPPRIPTIDPCPPPRPRPPPEESQCRHR